MPTSTRHSLRAAPAHPACTIPASSDRRDRRSAAELVALRRGNSIHDDLRRRLARRTQREQQGALAASPHDDALAALCASYCGRILDLRAMKIVPVLGALLM